MRNVVAIVLFLSSLSSFAASKTSMNLESTGDNLKWTRLGYEVARAHAPDYDIAGHIVYETCGDNVEFWSPKKSLGESWEYAPTSYHKTTYHEGSVVLALYYKCTQGSMKNVGSSREKESPSI